MTLQLDVANLNNEQQRLEVTLIQANRVPRVYLTDQAAIKFI